MIMRNLIVFIFLLSTSKAFAEGSPIVASINPIYQIILSISGGLDEVILIIDPNVSEHNYYLKKSDLNNVKNAKVIFYVDNSLENNFAKLINSLDLNYKSYQLSKIKDLKLIYNNNQYDKHIWLNLDNAILIADFIKLKLCELNNKNCSFYKKNFDKFKKELLEFSKINQKKLLNYSQNNFIFYHSSIIYFEDYFQLRSALKMINNNHSEIKIKDYKTIENLLKDNQIKCIFADNHDEKNTSKRMANKHNIGFRALDIIGKKNYSSDNGYLLIIEKLIKDFSDCLEQNY